MINKNKIQLYFVQKSTWFDKEGGPKCMSLTSKEAIQQHIANKLKDSYDELLKDNIDLHVIKANNKINIDGLGLYLLDSGDDYGHIRSFTAIGVFCHNCKVVEFDLQAYDINKALRYCVSIYDEFNTCN